MPHVAHRIRTKAVERPSFRRIRPMGRTWLISVSVFALTFNIGAGFTSVSGSGVLSTAQAHISDEMEVFADLQPLDDMALEQQRGGFKIGNFDINVGVSVTTTVEGFATVTTNISVEMPGELKNLGTQISAVTQDAVNAAKTATEAAVEAAKDAAQVAVEAAKVAVQAANSEPGATGAGTETQPTTAKPDTGLVNQLTGNSPNTETIVSVPEVTEVLDGLNEVQQAIKTAADAAIAGSKKALDGAIASTVDGTVPAAVAAESGHSLPTPMAVFDDSIQTAAVSPASTAVSGTESTPKQQHPATPSAKDIVAAATASVPEPVTKIIHQTTQNGHLSVISNTLNGLSIQQTVSMNLTVDNFHHVQSMVNIQRNLSTISRQIGLFSLRH